VLLFVLLVNENAQNTSQEVEVKLIIQGCVPHYSQAAVHTLGLGLWCMPSMCTPLLLSAPMLRAHPVRVLTQQHAAKHRLLAHVCYSHRHGA
jgi:hypothetical protein